MTEEEKPSVEAEASLGVAEPESTQSAEELQKAEAFAQKSKENDQDRNWKEARRKMQDLEKKAKEQEEVINRLTTPKPAQEVDELDKLGDEDIVTKGQAKKLAAKMAEEIANRVIKQREASTVDERLQLKYSDFAQVVTAENIEILKQTEPELAESLSFNPDPFKQGVAVYKLLKKANIGASDMADKPSKEKEKAIANSQKPVSVNAVTKQQSAIGNAHLFENGLTPELKAALNREMRECAKRA